MTTSRGQALVVLALSLLILCVMLAMTLAIGHRCKERVELQTIADVAAYDTAQATARAFNSFAVLNRSAVAHWVALSGTEALIAWSGPTADPSLAMAHEQARDIQIAVARIEILEEKLYEDLMFEVIQDQKYQRAAAAMADGQPDPGRGMAYHPPGMKGTHVGAQLGCREVCHAAEDADLSLADYDDLDLTEIAQAVQGSRGHAFTVVGTPTEAVHTYILDDLSPATLYARVGDDAYYDADWVFPWWYKSDATTYSVDVPRWQGIAAVSYPMPPAGPWAQPTFAGPTSAIISTAQDDPNGRFGAWTSASALPLSPAATLGARNDFFQDLAGDNRPQRLSHPIPKHPGVFRGGFGFVDGVRYHAGKYGPYGTSPVAIGWDDLYGQPKLPMMMWRWEDPGAPPSYPWELVFRFRFSASSSGAGVDLHRSRRLEMGNDTFLFHAMGAFASGLAYYHRPGHWAEPANMLNPFWRATLVPTDIDVNGQSMMAALGHMSQLGSNHHEEHWQEGWRPGDVGDLTWGGFGGIFGPLQFPELMELEYRFINQGGYTAVP